MKATNTGRICPRCRGERELMTEVLDYYTHYERCDRCGGTGRIAPEQEARDLDPTTGPWLVDSIDAVGDNWLIADLGLSPDDDVTYIVTTDGVPVSEFTGDARTDGEWIVWCRNHWDTILQGLDALAAREAQVALDAWNRS